MGQASTGTTHDLQCPDCETDLELAPEGSNGVLRLFCPGCGGRFRAALQYSGNDKATPNDRATPVVTRLAPITLGPLALHWRALVLRILEHLYWSMTIAGSMLLLALGGFIPVLRGWLAEEIYGWADVVRTLGGIWFCAETRNPDSDLGPVLARVDAPLLFSSIDTVARRLSVRPPGQVRLTYLPCCGVVAWGRSQALIIGLPLLRVLTQVELHSPGA